MVLRLLIGMVISLAIAWALFLIALVLLRPKGMTVAEARRIVPDTVRLLRSLANDPNVPRGVRRRLSLAIIYLALPIDLVPDFIPLIGYADDVIIVAMVLRSVVKRAGPEAIANHWSGTQDGLVMVRRICRL
jgi:uncharacterized membrane protein YkvA (DUF1232 family)